MRFLMLMIPAVYQPGAEPPAGAGVPDAEAVAPMMRFNEELKASGALLALDGLHPPASGARVSFKGGRPLVTDGPFAEAKEVIGGYWIIRAASKAEAVAWARKCPAGPGDIVEVRQIQEMDDFPDAVIEAARANAPELMAEMAPPKA